MINGKQLNSLCKVLNVFTEEIRLDHSVAVDPAHVMMCVVEETDLFGSYNAREGINLRQILNMKIEDENFNVFFRNGRYVLENEKRQYAFPCIDPETLIRPKPININIESTIETDAKTLLKAVEKCEMITDHCTIHNGKITASSKASCIEASIVLGDDDGNGKKCMYPINFLKRVAKVITGKVTIGYDNDCPMQLTWTDGYYHYRVYIAPRIEQEE